MTAYTYPAGARPMIMHPELTAETMRNFHCAFEHSMPINPGEPPRCIFVSACKLSDLFTMREAINNSEWARMTNNGKVPVIVTILAITNTALEATRVAFAHMQSLPEWPHCNKHGYNLDRASRRIKCSDGREFNNQEEAARAINCTPSAISQHMRGKLAHVKGYRFEYLNRKPGEAAQ